MHRVLRATTPIRYPGYQLNDSHATGFFYRTNSAPYLVTSRHCLFQSRHDPGGPFKPNKIAIKIRDRTQHRNTVTKEIQLYDQNGDPKWIEPNHYHVDIAAIELDFSLSETGTTFFGSHFLGKGHDAHRVASPGESAIVAGYPVLNAGSYSPVLRNALISTALDVNLDSQPYFLIDSNLHQGTSGSPVLVKEVDDEGRIHFTAIGVHSGQYDLMDNGSENLNQVWFLSHLRERLNDIEPNLIDMW
ncbi:trypsin-like peptidase domain-containing protein [Haloferax larsenii]|uniref:Trypsin-like peptidase domain-containing protein n=1 Tax=Haloferax larsenii TaxID=302484 RepID=A0A1H7TV48_HALLR|nr:trypsin-like peptidase domain-containing protein [Haloferax larsenii]SEL88712.1 Trypsin-like peptidase domain-containing protein [Haloferax larsenii]